ncbi:Agamous-like MADS-box protein AGL80 [Acorus gramineus]|uniref:Agamous-like MADS-box protein AGL80 n=1 Tax=Acorus gramineus TaxID=55184 RepID=A0AAV9B2E2_ACOGR|nr:Agamous-like MADS-box protein AGL80 [Acorus gramineus]
MARNKIKLVRIANDASRRATLKKRKNGMMKKVRELSTLCDVPACLVVYASPTDRDPVAVWPENRAEAERVMERFRGQPAMERDRRMLNQEAFLRQRMTKSKEQIKKLDRENRQLELTNYTLGCLKGEGLDGFGMEDVTELLGLLEVKAKAVGDRIEYLRRSRDVVVAVPPTVRMNVGVQAAMEEWRRQEWFMEMGFQTGESLSGFSNNNIVGTSGVGGGWSGGFFPSL